MAVLLISIFFFVILYTLVRFLKAPRVEVLNPFMYILVFSSLYYLIGGFQVEYVGWILGVGLSSSSYEFSKVLSIYTVLVYLFFFWVSSFFIKSLDLNYALFSRFTGGILFSCLIILFSISIFILLKYSEALISFTGSRAASYALYRDSLPGIPFGVVLNISLLICFLLYVNGWRVVVFLLALPVPILQMLSGGRTYLSVFVIALFISYVFKRGRQIGMISFLLIFSLVGLLLMSFKFGGDLDYSLYSITAEFAHTFQTIPYVLENELLSKGDSVAYYFNPLLKFLGLKLELIYFGDYIHEHMGTFNSMAGNNITEALFYGGVALVLLQPIATSIFLLMVIMFSRNFKLLGVIFIFMICIYLRTMVRGGMYEGMTGIFIYSIFVFVFVVFLQKINLLLVRGRKLDDC